MTEAENLNSATAHLEQLTTIKRTSDMRSSLASLLATLVLVTGCAGTFQIPETVGTTGRFPDADPIGQKEIKTSKPFAGIKEIPFIYVRSASDAGSKDQQDTFFQESFKKLNFPKAIGEEELTKLVIKGGLTNEIQNLSHPIALHRLSRIVGPFLAMQITLFRVGDARFRIDSVVFDPVSAEVIFSATREKLVWASVDDEILFPMMNALKGWYDNSSLLPAPLVKPAPAPGV
ncbi:MAG: hypothetical protein K0M73_17185 [Hydrogenophaga sp.]|nr:hypothetical protein [Hydrogenophaga sp.]